MRPTRAIYDMLLHITRSMGFEVKHRKMGRSGDYAWHYVSGKIVIDSAQKYKKLGVSLLAHELFHGIHHQQGRFAFFFNTAKFKRNKKNWRLVCKAETTASKDGRKFLESMGIKGIYFRELDPALRSHMESLWQEYFED